MTRIVHLSDTHFGTEVSEVVVATVRAVNELQPDLVVISGDVTQRARVHEFQAALAFLKQLPASAQLLIPGNHDIPLFNLFSRVCFPYKNYRNAFGNCESSWTNGHATVLGFNTTRPARHTRGSLGVAQIFSQVRRTQHTATDTQCLIACVHQPLYTEWIEDRSEVLMNAPQVAQALAANNIDLVLSGHVHVPFVKTTHQIFPTLERHFVMAGAGTAISYRTRRAVPNSFNSIVLETRDAAPLIAITCHQFNSALQQFNAHDLHCFGRTAQGWQML